MHLFFVLFNHLFIILFVGFASITWKCEELWCNSVIMKEISLDTLWNLNDPQILFQNLLSKNYLWRNTLSLSKVIIYYEIETFTKKSTWSWRWHHFSIFLDNIKNRFVVYSTISHYSQTAWKMCSVKGQQNERIKESQNNHFKLKARTFF